MKVSKQSHDVNTGVNKLVAVLQCLVHFQLSRKEIVVFRTQAALESSQLFQASEKGHLVSWLHDPHESCSAASLCHYFGTKWQ